MANLTMCAETQKNFDRENNMTFSLYTYRDHVGAHNIQSFDDMIQNVRRLPAPFGEIWSE